MNCVQIISIFASGYEISTWRQNPKLSCIYIFHNIKALPRLIFWKGVKVDFVESLKLKYHRQHVFIVMNQNGSVVM